MNLFHAQGFVRLNSKQHALSGGINESEQIQNTGFRNGNRQSHRSG